MTHPVDPLPTAQRSGPDRFPLVSAALLLLSFVLLPVLLLWADANLDPNGKYWLTPIFLVNPVLFLVLSLIAGRRFGARVGLFVVAALAFFAVSALFVYNETALVYVLVYLPIALLGWGIGATLRLRRSPAA